MIEDDIRRELVINMKAKDSLKVTLLRFLLSQFKYAQIENKAPLTDEQARLILRKEVKKRQDAILLYEKAGRLDIVESENKQIALINNYLPSLLPYHEVKLAVKKIVDDNPDLEQGRLTGEAMKRLKNTAAQTDILNAVRECFSR